MQRYGSLNFIIVLASLTIQIEVFRGTDESLACPCTVVVLYM